MYIIACRRPVTLNLVRQAFESNSGAPRQGPRPLHLLVAQKVGRAEIYGPLHHPGPSRTVLSDKPQQKTREAPRRVQAVVALRLLEVMRDQDLPPEILEDEDPTVTMPRRLGLSDVVDRQIRSYREDVRRRARLTDIEVRDLFRLVIRRPDAEQIFYRVGRLLAGPPGSGPWRRMVPRRLVMAMARGGVQRRLQALFGRRIGGFARGRFAVEGRSLLFIEADPGGDACSFMSGLCQAVLERATGRPAQVTHSLCQARGDDLCRWEGGLADTSAPSGDGETAPAGAS
jgi:hypothetical protein